MSSTALKWAKRQVIEDRTFKAILSELARGADDLGRCEVTQSKLAGAIGLAARTIERSMPAMEACGLFIRNRQLASQHRGRAADLITLSLDRDFTLTKEKIMGVKRMGPNRQNVGMNSWDQTDKMSGGPKSENDVRLYRERARGVIVGTSPPVSHNGVSVSTHVRFDRGRSKWRASITACGVTMDLGRFDRQSEAEAYAAQAQADARRTSQCKAGTPSKSVVSRSTANMTSPNLGSWLFGDDDATTESQTNAGAAVVLGQGATLLAGRGAEPRKEPSEQEAARARKGANDDHDSGRAA